MHLSWTFSFPVSYKNMGLCLCINQSIIYFLRHLTLINKYSFVWSEYLNDNNQIVIVYENTTKFQNMQLAKIVLFYNANLLYD